MASKPIIAYDNQAQDGVATATTEAAGWPVENLQDLRPDVQWKGTGTAEQDIKFDAGVGNTIDATCMGVVGHDLFTQGATNILLQESDDDIIYNTVVTFTPTSDSEIFKIFSLESHRYWRFRIPTGYTAAPFIGVIFLGPYIQFPRFPRSPFEPLRREFETAQNLSRQGRFVGAITEFEKRMIEVSFRSIERSWIDANWEGFYQHGPNPFFWAWNVTDFPLEVFYVIRERPRFDAPFSPRFTNVELRMRGPVE